MITTKYTFTMNGHVYFAPTRYDARNFLNTWDGVDNITSFETTWKIDSVERAPKWVPEQLNVTAGIEYGK
jgi:hypothetical protein